MNELYWVITILISFLGIILFYKLWGKTGLFVWLSIATITANIQTIKIVEIFNIETALGTVLYGTTFLATDLLNEIYGNKIAKKGIMFAFVSMVTVTILMSMSLIYTPSVNDIGHNSLNEVFTFNVKVTLASILAFLISQMIDSSLYCKLKEKKYPIWIRNNLSTLISQLVDTAIFIFIVYFKTVSTSVMIEIAFFMYVFKFLIALIDTPFMYLALRLKSNK
ncbi:MAG: queuosine precursor transporter [Tenericutes bacterium]|nr:queuosine precursor transporter [Mycoplasmatota bacterium]